MQRARPTLRCLTEDLKLPIPSMNEPLDEIDHPVLAKTIEQFAADNRHERIRAIDDQILFKVKVQRWRGAVWLEPDLPWLVAAGWRESGSSDDFYATLAADGQAARSRYNSEHKPSLKSDTHTAHLLPGRDDLLRYRVEAGVRFVRRLEALIPDLVRRSLHDGHEHVTDLDAFVLGIQVRADHGHETYVAIRIVGSVPGDLTKVILDIVPGCDQAGWYPEAALPGRRLSPNEQAWSNIMDPSAAAKLLDDER
ncbi:MAG TPA: hypothetical protein DGG94_08445 [Micromonosporaceae bacterium]|nr:hypothetical protein [Micromonosporaceae bacterium]HCU49813.1 hypothetical protein [Micromonosporaceae bacterium]